MTRAARHPVLLHGFSGSAAAWGDGVVDGLAGAGMPPVLVDLPGHGRDAGNVDPRAFTAEAALGLVDAAGDWPTDLIGYSMGGRIALHYAVRFPERVRGLVLESASPGLADEGEREERRWSDEALAARTEEAGIDSFVEYWESRPLFESRRALAPAVLSAQRALRLANDPHSLAACLRGLGTGALPPLWDRLPQMSVPTLLMAGDLDRKFVGVAERMAGLLPDARVVRVPDAGHTVHLERPAEWVAAVVSFLAAI